jgi:hypothetical protein
MEGVMRTLLLPIDDFLRGRVASVSPLEPAAKFRLRQLLLFVVVFGLLYGSVMGAYGGVLGDRWKQVLFSATKVPFLLLATFVVSLPTFFVISTLLGVRGDFAESVRALLATQAALTIILASFAPFTALWYASVNHYEGAILFNAIMFGLASLAAQMLLRRFYAPLIARNPRHRVLVRIWIVLFAFVGVQMAWVLRPFIGDPGMPTRFFRRDAWGNAYEVVWRMVWGLVSG